MIDPNEVETLVLRLQSSGVTMFECEGPLGLLRLRFASAAGQSALAPASDLAIPVVPLGSQQTAPALRSPGIGHVRLRHPLAGDILVREGEHVSKGQIVAVLQVDEVLVPVEADRDAVAARILVGDGDLIGYGSPILELG